MMFWGDKRYYALKYYLKHCFGEKVFKIPLDAGFSCPNRDGTLSSKGCIFCSARGSGDFAGSSELSLHAQINQGIANTKKRSSIRKFIAYFQAFTNTYADASYLRKLYEQALAFEEIVGIAIATRPDCLSPEVLNLLEEISRKTFLWIELGLQTIHERTSKLINRQYDMTCFEEAIDNLNKRNIKVVCHTILGLPYETKEEMVETVKYLSVKKIQGIKLQLLHVLKDTALAEMYQRGDFPVLSREDYVNTIVDCLEVLSPEIVVHRLTGDGPKDLLIAPLWSVDKIGVLQEIDRELNHRNSWQGKYFKKDK